MPPVRTGSAFIDFVNASMDAANTAVDIFDKQKKEQARADLLNMQADFEIEQNRFMNRLKSSSDYSNWEKEFDDFIQKQDDAMQKASRSPYTARMATEMLQNYSTNLRKNVENQVFDLRNRDILLKNDDTKRIILSNDGLSEQEKLNQISNISNRDVLNGLITPERYMAQQQQTATDLYLNHYSTVGSALISQAIQEGKSADWIIDQIKDDDFSLDLRAVAYDRNNIDDYDAGNAQFTDISTSIDKNLIKKKAGESIRQSYNAALKTMQEENANALSERNTKIETLNSYTDRLFAYKQALYELDHNYSGNKISELTRNKYTALWKDKIKEIGDSGPNGTSGKAMALDTFYKDNPFSNFIQLTNEGEFNSYYDAIDTYFVDLKEKFMAGNFKETSGMTNREKEQYWQEFARPSVYYEILNSRELKMNMQNNFAGLYDRYEQFKKDFNANRQDYSEGSLDYIDSLINDIALSSNGKSDKIALEKNVEKVINLLHLGQFDKALKGGTQKQLTFAEENPDILHTDRNNNPQWLPGAEEKLKKTAEEIGKDMSAKTGIDLIFDHFENIVNDKNPIPIYKDASDKSANPMFYKAVTERNEKGKTTGIKLIDANGNEVKNAPRKGGTTLTDYNAKKEGKAAASTLKTKSKTQEKKVIQNEQEKEAELERRAKELIRTGQLPDSIKNNVDYKNATPAEKRIRVIAYLKQQGN